MAERKTLDGIPVRNGGHYARSRPAARLLPVLLLVSVALGGCAVGDSGEAVDSPEQAERVSTATPAPAQAQAPSGASPTTGSTTSTGMVGTPTLVALASPTMDAATDTPPLSAATETSEAPTATIEPEPTATGIPTDTPPAPTAEPTATALPPTEPPAAAPLTAELVTRVPPGQGEVALLFNGDAFEGQITTILETLRAYDTRLTFFLTGGYLDRYPEQVKAIDAAGNEIASHGNEHLDYRELSAEQVVSQINQWREKFRALTGKTGPTYWQPPYGYSNRRIQEAARDQGYTTIYWTRDVLDAVGQPKSKEFVLDRVFQTPGLELDGAIFLMHVDKDGTVEALPEILEELKRRGLRAVTVGELLRR